MDIPILFLVLTCLVFVLNGHGMATMAEKCKVHIVYLGEKQHDDPNFITNSHHDLLASIVGSREKASELMVYSYKHGFSGFAAKLTKSQAQKLAESPAVVRVMPNSFHRLQTTRSWDFLGLSSQSNPSNLLHKSNNGDGVIIGIFDAGVWPESESFNDVGLGPIPSRWKGICENGEMFNASKHCNRKIIGARWFINGFQAEYGLPLNRTEDIEYLSPRDANGHGTHTASTAAGSLVSNISFKGLAPGIVRGGAPKARLAIYKVCWNVLGGQCAAADILKAFDEAIHDGVDVLSLSIGSFIPMYSDVDERDGIATGSFHAVARGITVVCGAGNDGPAAQTVQNIAPWILTVAASTIDRAFPVPITLGNNKTLLGQGLFAGKEIGFTGLVYPESGGLTPEANGVCEDLSFHGINVTGKVVLCFTSKARRAIIIASRVVKAAGGVGLIVAKHINDNLYPCGNDFPCIEVDFEVGTKIVFYIRSNESPLVKLSPSKTYVGKPLVSKVAHFSSRGPNSIAPAILKPDITGPGVNILAATSPLDPVADRGYVMHSGTSMSTPHLSGIVALLKALHPHWSPATIKSALVTTAWERYPFGMPIFAEGSSLKLADSFDYGGGLVNPNAAADPGLVFDMNTSDYIDYLCSMNYNSSSISRLTGQPTICIHKPSILNVNLPSITIPSLRSSITITRTVTNVGAPNSIYRAKIHYPSGIMLSVKPHVLVFNATIKKISFEVTLSATHQMNTGFLFGSLIWTDSVHSVRIPLSVRTEMPLPYADGY
ncbi:hypothetical protein UlMin_001669 [Ulmus minor]